MGIKHKAVKAASEPGYASEWNDEHVVNSDIDFEGYSGTNVGEPIDASDIATKNYVDGLSSGGGGMKLVVFDSSEHISTFNFNIPANTLNSFIYVSADAFMNDSSTGALTHYSTIILKINNSEVSRVFLSNGDDRAVVGRQLQWASDSIDFNSTINISFSKKHSHLF